MKKENVFDFRSIKTFEDACSATGTDTETINLPGLTDDELAYRMLKIVVKAINNGWTPDWNNFSQWKYYAWFNLSSGSGFSDSLCDFEYSDSGVGSRLCFESREKCEYAAKQFKNIYMQFFTTTQPG